MTDNDSSPTKRRLRIQKQSVFGKAGQARQEPERCDLNHILDREKRTRTINDNHVFELAESIADIGLIHPIAIDENGRLLAGAHRLAAVRLLQNRNLGAFTRWFTDGVPVMRIEVGSGSEAERVALAIELSENEKRRDYTKQEVLALAERLKEAGYRDIRGRPREGEKALGPALSLVLGKSLRTVRRLLSDSPPPVEQKDDKRTLLKRCQRTIDACLKVIEKTSDTNEEEELKKGMIVVKKLLQQSLETMSDDEGDDEIQGVPHLTKSSTPPPEI